MEEDGDGSGVGVGVGIGSGSLEGVETEGGVEEEG